MHIVYKSIKVHRGLIMSEKDQTQKNTHSLSRQEQWIKMSYKEVKHVFTYYFILLVISLLWVTFSVLYHFEFSKLGFSNVVGIFMFAYPSGVLGADIYYIRKLYKSCIQNLIEEPISKDDQKITKIGAKVYFYIRPIISGILSILINIGIITGFYIINNQNDINNEYFFLLIILISFYIGFSNGKVIIRIEKHSADIINTIFKSKEN